MGAREERICWPGGAFGSDLAEPVVEGSSTKEIRRRSLPQAAEPGHEIVPVATAHEVRYIEIGVAGKDRVGGGQGEGWDTRTAPTGHSFEGPPDPGAEPKRAAIFWPPNWARSEVTHRKQYTSGERPGTKKRPPFFSGGGSKTVTRIEPKLVPRRRPQCGNGLTTCTRRVWCCTGED